MNTKFRSKCVRAMALVLLLVAVLALPSSVFAQRVCNSEAHEWVAAHRGDLPSSYENLSLFPLNYRRAIYAALPATAKSRLWRFQLDRYLQREDELTPQQKEVLLDAIQLATPDTFVATHNRSTPKFRQMRQQLVALEARAQEAFGTDRAERIFARIGPADADTLFFVDRRAAEAIEPRLEGVGETRKLTQAACSCADQSDYCSGGFNCTQGGCTRISNECGTFWTWDCDGLCQPNAVIVIVK